MNCYEKFTRQVTEPHLEFNNCFKISNKKRKEFKYYQQIYSKNFKNLQFNIIV